MGNVAQTFGWRTPINTTAQAEMRRGATGDPEPWRRETGIAPRDVEAALASEPASVQERWFARLYSLKPLIFGVFGLFWIVTGVISLGPGWNHGMSLLTGRRAGRKLRCPHRYRRSPRRYRHWPGHPFAAVKPLWLVCCAYHLVSVHRDRDGPGPAIVERPARSHAQDLAGADAQFGGDGDPGGPVTFYLLLKTVHVIGAAVLLGTGAGIAFFLLVAYLRGEPREVAGVAQTVVLADFLFTATAIVLQPITGVWLAWLSGYSLGDGWIAASILLYVVTGAFWLPVVWMQMRMRDLAIRAVKSNSSLPYEYTRLFRWWFAFGFPAFVAILIIFWLMIARPAIPYWD
jgi:uncharacterized membrane protein